MMEDCHQLERNAEKLKTEGKEAIKGATTSLLDISREEKENCKIFLCGPEKTQEMLAEISTNIGKLTAELEQNRMLDGENVNEITEEMEQRGASVENLNAGLRKQIENLNDGRRKCKRNNTRDGAKGRF